MKKTTTLLAIAAGTALLAACGSGAAEPRIAPVAAPQVAAAPAATAPAATAPAASAQAPATAGLPVPVSDPGATVDADDQSGDGSTVVVREARVTAGPGWVVIRTDDDSAGRILGVAPLQPGQSGPVTVTLTEPVPDTTGDDDDLTAVLHLDDGDGVFDERTDPAILDEDDDDGDRDDSRGDDVEDDDFDMSVV